MFVKWMTRIKPVHVFVLTLLLTLPALFSGYLGDDYIHHALLSPEIVIPKANDWSLFGLFSWVDATPERNRVLMDLGVIPWWTYDGMRYLFWRPLAEISHWVDHQWWREYPWLMHVHSLLWYLLLGYLLHKLYLRAGLNARTAVVALFVFMLDATHGTTLGWIANRNAIMAAVFGVLCLLSYLDWHESGKSRALFISIACLLLSLFSGEIGISITCYLGAHALLMSKRGPLKGLVALWPYVLVSVLWWSSYKLGNFGANNSDVNYIDPIESPLIFLSHLGARVPVLLFSQFGLIPAEVYGFSPPPFLSFLVIAAAFLLLVIFVLFPLLKQSEQARFWALGTFLRSFRLARPFLPIEIYCWSVLAGRH